MKKCDKCYLEAETQKIVGAQETDMTNLLWWLMHHSTQVLEVGVWPRDDEGHEQHEAERDELRPRPARQYTDQQAEGEQLGVRCQVPAGTYFKNTHKTHLGFRATFSNLRLKGNCYT